MDLALAIEKLLPAAKYFGSVTANAEASYTELVWNDTRSKPTWTAILAADASLPVPQTAEEIKAAEMAAFASAEGVVSQVNLIALKIGLK